MFKNIMVATDGSAHAMKAVKTAADIAAKYRARLTIITVLPSSLSMDEVRRMPQAKRFPKSVRDEIRNYEKILATSGAGEMLPALVSLPAPSAAVAEIGEQILIDAEKTVKDKGITEVKRLAVGGHPGAAIAEYAKKLRADLIVMGTRGLSDLSGIVLGSTSHKVLHLAGCPCLCVR